MPIKLFRTATIALLALIAMLLIGRHELHAAAAFLGLEPLGPASSLVLQGDSETNRVELTAVDNHLAWGKEASHRAWSEAYVAIGVLLDGLMRSDSFSEDRRQLAEGMQGEERAIIEKIEDIKARMDDAEPDDPEMPVLAEEGRRLLQLRQQFIQGAQLRQSELTATQLEAAYRELIEAVKVVAERRSIDIVHRFIPTDEPFGTTNAADALIQIRLRNLLLYPDALDLTSEVADDLGVDMPGG
jgi:hypothetical protein